MISHMALKFGPTPSSPPVGIPVTPITVFVGPNNSGKSKILEEIHGFCSSGQAGQTLILKNLDIPIINEDEIKSLIDSYGVKHHRNQILNNDQIAFARNEDPHPRSKFIKALQNTDAASRRLTFCQWFLRHNLLRLDGTSRINHIGQQKSGDLQQQPGTTFQKLFRDDNKRQRLRQIVFDAFGKHLVIDPTNPGNLRLRLSNTPPLSIHEERGLDENAINFHSKANPIEQASDGIKAFVGIMTEVIAGNPAVLMIDEPEAFLHPSLAFTLGKELSRTTYGSNKRIFISTHSPFFVMGCIQSGTPVTIVRLTYKDNVPTARSLPQEELLTLMRNPLLRSIGVMSALFYDSVIVTESDADRAFYSEINERLLFENAGRGIKNCLFLNAQNCHTVGIITKPLRNLGIPAAGIVDIDIIKNGGTPWINFLKGAFIPEIDRESLSNTRNLVSKKFDEVAGDMKKSGLSILQGDALESAKNLFDRLDEYGMFVVRIGEIECWLKHLNAAGHTPEWLIDIFQKMGEDPFSRDYVRPAHDDVWNFIDSVRLWLSNQLRKGIPS